jgi:hypothetical protein
LIHVLLLLLLLLRAQVVCQHGQLECDLNKLLSCASAQHPMQDDFFPVFVCMEQAVMSGEKVDVGQLAHKCAVHAGMVTEKLMACYNGEAYACVWFASSPVEAACSTAS